MLPSPVIIGDGLGLCDGLAEAEGLLLPLALPAGALVAGGALLLHAASNDKHRARPSIREMDFLNLLIFKINPPIFVC